VLSNDGKSDNILVCVALAFAPGIHAWISLLGILGCFDSAEDTKLRVRYSLIKLA
jgi:hypothetical protein